MRRVRLISSVPLLAAWLDLHPFRENPEAPLWCRLGTNGRYEPLNYPGMKAIIQRTAKRAGIRKRIYAHLFRHSRATDLAGKLTEAQLKEFFGWVQSSRQAATYVHLSGRDVDDALLRIYGLKKSEEADNAKQLKPKTCARCKSQNSYSSEFCNRCGMPVDLRSAYNAESERNAWDKVMNELLQDPEVQSVLVHKIKELNLRLPR